MAATLLCRRLVSLPKLCRSLRWHDPWERRPLEKRLWLYRVDDWGKKKDLWEGDLITDESDEESDSALTQKDSESTTNEDEIDEKSDSALTQKDTELTTNEDEIDEKSDSAVTQKDSELSTKEECSQNSESTTNEKCTECFVWHWYKKSYPGQRPRFMSLFKIDCGPHAHAHITQTYNKYLKIVLGNRCAMVHHLVARSFLTDMVVNGAIPDLTTFSILIRPYCMHLKYQYIVHVVFTQMRALKVEADDSFFKSLINGVCVRFGPNVGYQLLDELRSRRGLQMPLTCYDAVVRQFCKKKTAVTSGLIDVLADMKHQRLFPDNKIYNCLIKGQRYHSDEAFMKAAGIGRQIFTQGMKIGALSNIVQKKGPAREVWF